MKMKETPNKDDPQKDVEFIIKELLMEFNSPESDDRGEEYLLLRSEVGSTFHARVLNAARYLGLTE